MKRFIFIALLTATLGVSSGAAMTYATPDVLDCGSDTRGEWIDLQADFEYPFTPPESTHDALEAAGCPATGEPRYARPFRPGEDAGDRADYDPREPAAAPPSSEPQPDKRAKPRKRCKRKDGRRGRGRGKGKRCRSRDRAV